MYILIIVLPLMSFITIGLLGRKIGIKGTVVISSISIIISTIISIIGIYEIIICSSLIKLDLMPWIDILDINWGIKIDWISIMMCTIISTISSLVFLYTRSYMSKDPHQQRFYSYLNLFSSLMLVVVCSSNYLVLFLGWEGIGVSSYLLINFWCNRINSNLASYQALIMNRIGDWGLIIFIISIYIYNNNIDYDILFLPNSNHIYLTIISIFVIISSMAKSAQIGLQNWLPMSMEGPTPVSALLHAATLVTAGVYILIRTTNYLTSISLIIICIISSVTALVAALNGIYSYDIKKIIAYSTCSQLGYMLLAIGLNQYSIGLFHLLNHAYFKALLFLSAGSIIHSLNDEQDIRRMGGLIKYLPFTYTMILIGTLSLTAFPFLTGYYSKDLILEIASFDWSQCEKLNVASLEKGTNSMIVTSNRMDTKTMLINKSWTVWLGTFTVMLTTIYSMLTILYGFYGRPSINSIKIVNNIHEPSVYMSIPLIILSVLSITSGYYLKELFIPSIEYEIISITPYLKIYLPTIISITVQIIISLGVYFYSERRSLGQVPKDLLVNKKSRIVGVIMYDQIGNQYNKIVKETLMISWNILKNIDQGIIMLIGPYGLSKLIKNLSIIHSNNCESGLIRTYIYQIIVSIILIISFIPL